MSTDNDHGITDELREYSRAFHDIWLNNTNQTISVTTSNMPPTFDSIRMDSRMLAIADLIDEKHDAAMARLYRDMADADYMELPKDADGKYWHIGDKAKSVSFPESMARTVCGFGTLNGKPVLFYESENGGHSSNPHQGWDYAESMRRCDCDTWEDIIEAAYIRGAKDQWVNHDKRVTSYSFLNGRDLVDRCKAIAARGGGE